MQTPTESEIFQAFYAVGPNYGRVFLSSYAAGIVPKTCIPEAIWEVFIAQKLLDEENNITLLGTLVVEWILTDYKNLRYWELEQAK